MKNNSKHSEKDWAKEFDEICLHTHCGDCERGEPDCEGIYESNNNKELLKQFILNLLISTKKETISKLENSSLWDEYYFGGDYANMDNWRKRLLNELKNKLREGKE